MRAMTESEVQEAMKSREHWRLEAKQIARTWQFANFRESMAFVSKVAEKAEQMDHHPDILVKYNQVTLSLSTHDVNGLSEKDFRLAQFCDELA